MYIPLNTYIHVHGLCSKNVQWPHSKMTTYQSVAGQKKKQTNKLQKIVIVAHILPELSSHGHLASTLCRCSEIECCDAAKKHVTFFALIRFDRIPARCSAALLRCRCCDSQSWYRKSVRLNIRQKELTSTPSPARRVPRPTAVISRWQHISEHGSKSAHRVLRSKICRRPCWWS